LKLSRTDITNYSRYYFLRTRGFPEHPEGARYSIGISGRRRGSYRATWRIGKEFDLLS
jgi:hypothetical protein